MKYIFKKDPKRVIVYLILTIILALLMVSNSLVLKYIMDVASSKGLNKYVSLVINVLLFILVQSLAYYLQQLNSQYLAKEAVSVYRNVIFKRLSQQRLIKLNSNESGQYISLLTSQMDNLGQNYFYTFFWIILIDTIFCCQFALLDNKPSDGSICYYFKYSKYSDTNNF